MHEILFLHFSQGISGLDIFTWCRIESAVQWVAGAVPDQTIDVIDCDLLPDDEIIKLVLKYSPKVKGISTMTPGYPRALKIAGLLKQQMPKALNIFGGWHPSLVPQDVLKENSVDTVVIGRGENVVADILSRPNDFKGKIVDAREKPFNSVMPWRNKKIMNSLSSFTPCSVPNFGSISITPGCYFDCIYCATPAIFGKCFEERPLDQVLSEVKMLVEEYGVHLIYIRDENPFLQRKRLEEFCYLLVRHGLNKRVFFRSFGDVSLVDKSLLELLKEGGWVEIMYGIESGNLKRLKALHRSRTTPEKMFKVFEMTREQGIFMAAGFMIMYPGDDLDSLDQFKSVLWSLRPDRFFVSFYTPQPGTPSWRECQPFLREELGWEYFNGLYPVLKPPDNTPSEKIIEIKNRIISDYYESKEYQEQMKQWLSRLGDDFWPLMQNFRDKILRDFQVDIYRGVL